MGIFDPLHSLEQKVEALPAIAVQAGKVAVLRMFVKLHLTALIEEDPDSADKYRKAIDDIK